MEMLLGAYVQVSAALLTGYLILLKLQISMCPSTIFAPGPSKLRVKVHISFVIAHLFSHGSQQELVNLL